MNPLKHEILAILQQIGASSVYNHQKQNGMQGFFVNELSKGKSAKD